MFKKIYSWRYYSFTKEQYHECMDKLFINNLNNLRHLNIVIAVFTLFFSFFPLFIERNVFKLFVYLSFAFIAVIIAVCANYKMQRELPTNRFVYILQTIYFANVMTFGIYVCVLASPGRLASIFLCFLICALVMFINPFIYNLILTICAMAVFTILSCLLKPAEIYMYDIANVTIASFMSVYFCWQITKLRLGLELSTSLLEEERNKYFDQSTIDELTKLSNRRDFMQTFQRYVTNYRSSDDWLCVSIADIDFFKNYNDHYGHPQGDECLRSIGNAFNTLKESHNVYTARVGGEEFAILWFEKDLSHVNTIISAFSNLIKELKIEHEKSSISEFVTMSMGVYIEKCGASSDVDTLYNLADKALYRAKGAGRNRTVVTGREIEDYIIINNLNS